MCRQERAYIQPETFYNQYVFPLLKILGERNRLLMLTTHYKY